MAQRPLFCDFDGPIVDVSERYYATYKLGLEALSRHYQTLGRPIAIRYLSKSQFWTFKKNRVPDRQIAHWSGLDSPQIDQFLAQVKQQVNHPDLLHQDRLQPKVHEALDIFNQCGIRLVIVTLRPPAQVMQFLRQHHLEGAISELFGMIDQDAAYANQANHKIERLKQAIQAQQQQGYDPRRTWMVGDTEADIMAGQASGLDTVALTCGIRSDNYLKTFRPTYLMTDLWSVSQKIQQSLLMGRCR